MWNLIRNAVKFTPPGGSITVSTQNVDQETLQVCVKDSGIGFQSEVAPKLFAAFEQNSRNITRQFGGLGLGLTISRSIVLAHGGSIQAESAGPKKGATFTVELPLGKGAQTSFSIEPPSLSSGGRILRILLVEDHDDTRIAIEDLLRNLKHEIRSVRSAQGALELASQHQFDLVLSDLGLPDENGCELMSKLRARFGLRGIAVSGYGMKEDIERSREAGFIHHLTKPIDPDRLAGLIQDWGFDERAQ